MVDYVSYCSVGCSLFGISTSFYRIYAFSQPDFLLRHKRRPAGPRNENDTEMGFSLLAASEASQNDAGRVYRTIANEVEDAKKATQGYAPLSACVMLALIAAINLATLRSMITSWSDETAILLLAVGCCIILIAMQSFETGVNLSVSWQTQSGWISSGSAILLARGHLDVWQEGSGAWASWACVVLLAGMCGAVTYLHFVFSDIPTQDETNAYLVWRLVERYRLKKEMELTNNPDELDEDGNRKPTFAETMEMWSLVIYLLSAETWLIILGNLGALVGAMSGIGFIYFESQLLQDVSDSIADDSAVAKNMDSTGLCMGLCAGGIGLGFFLQAAMCETAGIRMAISLQKLAFSQIMCQDLSFFDRTKTGELTTILVANITTIQTSVTSPLADTLNGLVKFVVIMSYLLVILPKLTGIYCAGASVTIVFFKLQGQINQQLTKRLMEKQARQGEIAEEKISSMRTVISCTLVDACTVLYKNAADACQRVSVKKANLSSLLFGITLSCFYGSNTIALYLGAVQKIGNSSNRVKLISLFTQLAQQAGAGIAQVINSFPNLATAVGAAEKVFDIIGEVPFIPPVLESKSTFGSSSPVR
ncbi:hypothetical protein CYMTET_10068 [Cymbomonas tetramitiformis]|uniref:ABC transmembrane type-1 domain-containing protein n=1 Tax=Cymbomonas tetramitiformis TaxID=36881 RepID=A0AAE0LEI3_9CHLO|nr:hypothetical protein CYMTET_10068 [Cymbomonas tetramitiformis]